MERKFTIKLIVLLLFSLVILVPSCNTTCELTVNLPSFSSKKTSNEPEKEAFIPEDATPPPDYNPNFITTVKPFEIDTSKNYGITLIRREIDSNGVRYWFNITSDDGVNYIYADSSIWKKIWCETEEVIDSVEYKISKYKLKNITESDKLPYAFAFVLDHSGSMGDIRAYAVQYAISYLIGSKKKEDAFAIIKYDGRVGVEVPLTKDTNVLRRYFKINGLDDYGGMTAINDGLYTAIQILDTAKGYADKVAIIFTDGYENASYISKEDLIKFAKNKDIKIFTIDFGENTDGEYLKSIADSTGGYYYHIYRTEEFKYVFKDIYKRLKNIYVFEYKPSFFGDVKFKLKICLDKDSLVLVDTFEYKPEVGKVINLNIYFDTGKDKIKPKFVPEIDKLARFLKKYPDLVVEIRGHTDNVGSDEYNLDLSQRRADAVKNALIKRGISEDRLKTKGFGESMPIADNSTPEGRAMNRRTEVVIIAN